MPAALNIWSNVTSEIVPFLTPEKTLHCKIFANRVNGSSHTVTVPEKSDELLDLGTELMLLKSES